MPGLADTITPIQRLALAYCPRTARAPTLALMALDARLADAVRSSSEPLLAQIKLAWWRDMFARKPSEWPEGEPLLACLKSWEGRADALAGLADGWEAMTGQAPLGATEFDLLASARGTTFGALAELVGAGTDQAAATRLGRQWAIADIAAHLGNPDEREAAIKLAAKQDWRKQRLSRKLRPLIVLHGMAARSMRLNQALNGLPASAFLPTVRLGLLGR